MNTTTITSLGDEQIKLYTSYSENQLARINEPNPGIFICESPEVINRALNAGYAPISFLCEIENMTDSVIETMSRCDAPVYMCEHDVIKDLPGYGLTRGMLCAMQRKPLASVDSILGNNANISGNNISSGLITDENATDTSVNNTLDKNQTCRTIAILEDVMNPTNTGAIFRSAAALNVDAILLSPGCADPLYRRAARVSMGTVFQIPWTYINKKTHPWPHACIEYLKSQGYSIIATALRDDTLDIRDERIKSLDRKAIILGTEGFGIKDETLALCDYTVKIPMAHGVDSLNVAAASAITFWELAGK